MFLVYTITVNTEYFCCGPISNNKRRYTIKYNRKKYYILTKYFPESQLNKKSNDKATMKSKSLAIEYIDLGKN